MIRKHGSNITISKRTEQNHAASELAAKVMERTLHRPVDKNISYLLRHPREIKERTEALDVMDLLNDLYERFREDHEMNPEDERAVRGSVGRKYSLLLALSSINNWYLRQEILRNARVHGGLNRARLVSESFARITLGRI